VSVLICYPINTTRSRSVYIYFTVRSVSASSPQKLEIKKEMLPHYMGRLLNGSLFLNVSICVIRTLEKRVIIGC